MRKALGEELRPVRPKESQERRKGDEPTLAVLDHLDDEVAVGYAGPTVTDLDPGGPRFVFEQGAPGRLGDGCAEGRPYTDAALPPGVDLKDLTTRPHNETGLASGKGGHVLSLGSGSLRTASLLLCR